MRQLPTYGHEIGVKVDVELDEPDVAIRHLVAEQDVNTALDIGCDGRGRARVRGGSEEGLQGRVRAVRREGRSTSHARRGKGNRRTTCFL